MVRSKKVASIADKSSEKISSQDKAPSPEHHERAAPEKAAARNEQPAQVQEIQQIIVRQGAGWQTTALLCLSLLLLTTVGVAFYAFYRVDELNDEVGTTMRRVEEKIQNLDAGISFDSKRQQLLLGIRDEIMRTNPRVSLNQAYEYATLIMQASDKYPSVEPLMFLSIGIIESRYDVRATSVADAKGLYQIWPSTGRMLARSLDWEYSDELLYDPVTNTEMAALYLDILFAAYNDRNMVLAEYNGGPLNAGYYRAGSERTAVETRDYVEKVSTVYEELKNKFELGVEVTLLPMHKDRDRNGKLLGRTTRPVPVRPTSTGIARAESGVESVGQ
jgi:soluble lytic murein transglycosylase-like protein